jgi:histidinol-phosphate aminotransferase
VSVRFNRKLDAIPGYMPGAPAGKGAVEVAASDLVQLASNESPWGPLPEVVEAVSGALSSMNRYPDPTGTELRQAIASHHGVDATTVALANGSCELLLAAGEALLGPESEVVYSWPAFSIYPMLAPLSGAGEVRVPLAAGEIHDLDAMLAAITPATQLVLVCNPNNPTATYRTCREVGDFLDRAPDDVTVILDEAYIDFQQVDDPDDTVGLLSRHPNLVLLRTFSKSHSLAGFRIGYALGSPEFRAAVEAVRQPFSINAPAQVAATESLRHRDKITERIEGLVAERERVLGELAGMGLEVTDSQANFAWVSLGSDGETIEPEVVTELKEARVLVRPGSLLGGPGWLRITFGTREEDDHMLGVLARSGAVDS